MRQRGHRSNRLRTLSFDLGALFGQVGTLEGIGRKVVELAPATFPRDQSVITENDRA